MTARAATAAVLGLTLVQLVVATAFAADLPQFEGKGFGARLITYPLLMLAVPAGWCLLAVAWEAAEWYILIRHGTELDTAYTDTLGDLVLGCIGGAVAGAILARTASADRLPVAG